MGLVWPCSGWGLPCPRRRRRGGELLPRHFTLAPRKGHPFPRGGMFSVALSPGRPESLLATILPFGVRTFLLSPLAGRRGDRLARSGRYLYTVLLELRKG